MEDIIFSEIQSIGQKQVPYSEDEFAEGGQVRNSPSISANSFDGGNVNLLWLGSDGKIYENRKDSIKIGKWKLTNKTANASIVTPKASSKRFYTFVGINDEAVQDDDIIPVLDMDGNWNYFSASRLIYAGREAKPIEEIEKEIRDSMIKDKIVTLSKSTKKPKPSKKPIIKDPSEATTNRQLGAIIKKAIKELFNTDVSVRSGRYGFDARPIVKNWDIPQDLIRQLAETIEEKDIDSLIKDSIQFKMIADGTYKYGSINRRRAFTSEENWRKWLKSVYEGNKGEWRTVEEEAPIEAPQDLKKVWIADSSLTPNQIADLLDQYGYKNSMSNSKIPITATCFRVRYGEYQFFTTPMSEFDEDKGYETATLLEFFNLKEADKEENDVDTSLLDSINEELSDMYSIRDIDEETSNNAVFRKETTDLEDLKKITKAEIDFDLTRSVDQYFRIYAGADLKNEDIPKQEGAKSINAEPTQLNEASMVISKLDLFKEWFGDWEKAYKDKSYIGVSKIINPETAEPLIVYHGSTAPIEFSRFKFDKFPVMYFAKNKDYAQWFANQGRSQQIYEVFLDIKELADFTDLETKLITWAEMQKIAKDKFEVDLPKHPTLADKKLKFWQWLRGDHPHQTLINAFKEAGFTGFAHIEDNPSDIQPNGEPMTTEAYTIFSPEQAKSIVQSDYKPYQNLMKMEKGGELKEESLMDRINKL